MTVSCMMPCEQSITRHHCRVSGIKCTQMLMQRQKRSSRPGGCGFSHSDQSVAFGVCIRRKQVVRSCWHRDRRGSQLNRRTVSISIDGLSSNESNWGLVVVMGTDRGLIAVCVR